jgi:phage tail-like protein
MATRVDPYRGYNFKLEIEGVFSGGFRECTGLDTTSDPIDYREGDEKVYTARKLAGLVKYANIVLKRGITDDGKKLLEWRKKIIDGKEKDNRKNVTIHLCDETGEQKITWNIVNAWPTKWTGMSLNATANEVAIETLEIVHEGFTEA